MGANWPALSPVKAEGGMVESGLPWMVLSYFGLAVASAVFPWVSSEVIVMSLPSMAPSKPALLLLLLVATAGHMTGKCFLYWAGRKGGKVLPGRAGKALTKWRERLETKPSKAVALVLISSLVGLPPFFLMTLLAGSLRMNFLVYLTAGTTGRLIRFGALVMLPQLALSFFKGGA
jgi:membrane protein YqaA with SNARE-associated domain